MGKKKDLQVEYEKLFGEKPKNALTIGDLEAAIAKGPAPVGVSESVPPQQDPKIEELKKKVPGKEKPQGRVKVGSLI